MASMFDCKQKLNDCNWSLQSIIISVIIYSISVMFTRRLSENTERGYPLLVKRKRKCQTASIMGGRQREIGYLSEERITTEV